MTTAQAPRTDIGLILVHGIGEQGRFEHLDAHIRGIIGGFRRSGAHVTVEIMSADAAAFHSAQDTWLGGPHASCRLLVDTDDRKVTINVHEVWWADVNEPYSLMKQLRFWVWGLSVWNHPRQDATFRTGSGVTRYMPVSKTGEFWVRVRLFLIGCFFLLSSLTLGLVTFVAKRLFNLNAFSFVKTFVNYLSSVKLYNQSQRGGAGPFSNADFLDALGERPRDSIRRRMIRTMCDVATNPAYDGWYIFAHSQGSVVAFNGLMEPGAGWTGYLDEARLGKLRSLNMTLMGNVEAEPLRPARPVWSAPGEMVDRSRIFEKFRGLLTYGSPLEKFQAIWPGRVPVFEEVAFQPDTRWINVFDPLDAVSGAIHTWNDAPRQFCPKVENIGYKASRFLLLGHIKYLECPYGGVSTPRTAAMRLLGWLARPMCYLKSLVIPKVDDAYGGRLADRAADWLVRPQQAFR